MSGLMALRLARGGERANVEILRALVYDNQTSNFSADDTITGAGVKGTGTLTGTTIAAADTVTIGGVTYTYIATVAAPNDVDVGATDSISLDNLIAAINKDAGEGTLYGTGTVIHPDVSAAAGAGDTMDVTGKVADGVATATTASLTAGDWGAATLQGRILASGATGVLVEQVDAGATGTLQLRDVVGEYTNNEELTNGASGDGLANGTLTTPLLTPSDSCILQVDAVDIELSEAIEMISYIRAEIMASDWHADNGLFALRIVRGNQVGDVERLGALAFDGQSVNFTVLNTILGGTSAASGILVEQTDAGATGTIIMKDIKGIFVNNDVLTDSPGSGDGDAVNAQTVPLLTPADSMIFQIDGAAETMTKSAALEILRQIRNTVYDMDWPHAA